MFKPQQTTWPMLFVYALILVFILRAVYKAFFTPLRSAQDYVNRAKFWVSYFRMHDKAISVLKKGLEMPTISDDDRHMLNFKIGIELYHKKLYNESVPYFEAMQDFFKKNRIPFDQDYAKMIISCYNAGEIKTARRLYHLLRKQETHEPAFSTLGALNSRIFKGGA